MVLQNGYRFNVIRGIQAKREYYTFMCPLRLVIKLLPIHDQKNPLHRHQRRLNQSRVTSIAEYLKDACNDYCVNSLTISMDADANFQPLTNDRENYNSGTIFIPKEARLIINDGQHRRAAIEKALQEKPELANETISIVLFIDGGLRRSPQRFVDLNYYGVRPSGSLRILYDQRDTTARLTRELVETVPLFRKYTELEQETLRENSSKLFALSTIYKATNELLAQMSGFPNEEKLRVAIEYWQELSGQIREWQSVFRGRLKPSDARKSYAHTMPVVLLGFGIVGRDLLAQEPDQWRIKLTILRKLSWKIDSTEWAGRLPAEVHLVSNKKHLLHVCAYLKHALQLPLSEEELEAELVYTETR